MSPPSHWPEGLEGGWGLSPSYREYAAECLRLAQRAANEDDRAQLLGMAQAWHALADKAQAWRELANKLIQHTDEVGEH
jgi:hypothetical protein